VVVLWHCEWKVTGSNLGRQNLTFIFTKGLKQEGNLESRGPVFIILITHSKLGELSMLYVNYGCA